MPLCGYTLESLICFSLRSSIAHVITLSTSLPLPAKEINPSLPNNRALVVVHHVKLSEGHSGQIVYDEWDLQCSLLVESMGTEEAWHLPNPPGTNPPVAEDPLQELRHDSRNLSFQGPLSRITAREGAYQD